MKRQDLFSRQDKEVCIVCAKVNSSGSKGMIGSAEKECKLTQKNLNLLPMIDSEDALMHEYYEDAYDNGEIPLIKEIP
jgi:hypothetical protein